jgi:hypothetical protein
VAGSKLEMTDLGTFLLLGLGWVLLQWVILPRLGVPT